jgi:hypothetical protein
MLEHAVRETRLHAGDVSFRVSVEPRGLRLEADDERLHQVIANLVERVQTKVDDADPEAVIAVLGGGMRVRDYLRTRTFELVVHSFDISVASGIDVVFSPAVLADAVGLAGRIAVAAGHGRTVLTALTGRGTLPAGFSIVE